MKNRVLIVKVRWNDQVNGQVKRVFFDEDNALDYINQSKVLDRYDGAEWILSDRKISDFEEPLSEEALRVMLIEAKQDMINEIASEQIVSVPKFREYLEDLWANLELERMKYEDEEL